MKPPQRVIEAYVHNGRIGVLVEIALCSELTAHMVEFKQLARDMTRQIAASPVETVDGLLTQRFIRDETVSVAEYLAEVSSKLHERFSVTRFIRWDAADSKPPVWEPPSAPAAAAWIQKRA